MKLANKASFFIDICQFYDLMHGTIKYQGITDEINKFIQN